LGLIEELPVNRIITFSTFGFLFENKIGVHITLDSHYTNRNRGKNKAKED
jgi:hypothetical protein